MTQKPHGKSKKNFVPNFPLMTTTDSQNFKEIQETDIHHVVTLEVDFPYTKVSFGSFSKIKADFMPFES